MRAARRRLGGLCSPPLVMCLLDASFTLLGQSPEYWSGDYALANEASPTFHHLLRMHPAAFALGIAAWGALFSGLILLLPEPLALLTSITATFGHTVGTATWLLWRFQFGYQAVNLLMVFSAALLAIGIHYGWQARPPLEDRAEKGTSPLRWLIIMALTAIAVYMFLWPRGVN